jgi:hypothetical protein
VPWVSLICTEYRFGHLLRSKEGLLY